MTRFQLLPSVGCAALVVASSAMFSADVGADQRVISDDGREVLLRVMGPGEAGGLTSMALSRTGSATLPARTDAQPAPSPSMLHRI